MFQVTHVVRIGIILTEYTLCILTTYSVYFKMYVLMENTIPYVYTLKMHL